MDAAIRKQKMRDAMRQRIYGDTMGQLIEAHAKMYADRLCVADPVKSYTYGQFVTLIGQKARQLAGMGVKRGDRVMAMASQRADFLALHFAVHRLGAVFVPLEKNLPQERINQIRQVTEAKVVLMDSELSLPEQKETEGDGELTGTETEPSVRMGEPAWPGPEETATILFTTGTTGVSKGIELSHLAEVAVAQNVYYGTEMEADTVELIPTPINHSYGLRHCLGLLLGGQSIVLCDGVTMAADFFAMMDQYQVNAVSLTPAAVNILTHLTGNRLGEYGDRLRYLQLGTAGVSPAMKEHLRNLLPHTRLYQYYSSTEAGCACIFDFSRDTSPRRVGRPACNSHFVVMDEEGRVMESSETNWGYLACFGPMNMMGYFREPELTKQTVIDGYVRSQDIGYLDEEGYLCFVGRAGDVINTGGNKVAPEEVENVAMDFGGIRECACSGVEDPLLGQVPKLYVVPEVGEDGTPFSLDLIALARYLANRLETFKLPREICLIRAVPRNYMGKPQRNRCEEAEPWYSTKK